jgi:hypothetical protein
MMKHMIEYYAEQKTYEKSGSMILNSNKLVKEVRHGKTKSEEKSKAKTTTSG